MEGDSLGGAARNLRCRLSTSSSTGMLSRPQRWPRRVGAIFTHTSRFPDARTPSSRLASKESLRRMKGRKRMRRRKRWEQTEVRD